MKNYLFYDEETGEHFFVQEVNLWKANQTAHLFFQRPFYKCSMSDAEAERRDAILTKRKPVMNRLSLLLVKFLI
jgi:hypothetical protein|nr:MAG TPA: hypothetical protein [Caudoviricetes sp.]